MTAINLPIANGFYQSDSLPISAQECLNYYPNIPQAPALNPETLFGTPGIDQLNTTGSAATDANRGSHELDGTPYFVNNNQLYRLEPEVAGTHAVTALGAIEGNGFVSMADNGTQLMILVPGGKGYIFTESPDTLTEIVVAGFRANGEPQYVAFINGFFICTTDSKKFIKSAANNGLAWDSLDFGTAEADPDDIVAPIVFNNQLYIGGSITIEEFAFFTTADFPIRRTGLVIPKGVKSPFSIINANNTFMWIGGGENEAAAVWQLNGNTPQKVSHTGIDVILSSLSDVELASIFSWSYASKGAYFVGFTLPNTTIVYDSITGRWHERKSRIPDGAGIFTLQRFRVNSIVTAYGKVLVGDSQDGRIGELNNDVYMEYENNILRRIATQPFQNNMKAMFVPTIELVCESGVGNADCPKPQIIMERSKDAKIWTDGRARSLGIQGEYKRRQIWRRNGRVSRFELFRWTVTDAVKSVIIQFVADIRGSTANG